MAGEKTNNFLNTINVFNKKSMTPTLILVYAVMIVLFSSINPLYISLENIKGIMANLTITGIMAVGLTTVMLTGNFDISVGSVLGVSAIICAKLYNIEGLDLPLFVVILAGIAAGAAIGALNGFLVTVVGINSIITTLGTLSVFRGFAYLFATETARIYYKPFIFVGRGYVFGNIPVTMLYFLGLLVLVYLILRFTRFGRNIYQVGANADAARLAGVSVKKTTFYTFMISGATAGLGGVVMASQLAFAQGEFGLGFEFKILTICVLAGISLAGGRGTLVGVLVATFILGSISNGLALTKVPIDWREAFQGIILIAAIMVDSIRVRR
ncbi:MAG: ABC transporter permease, partial [Actinomycetia bacterium]|nr:ABC transporter permease [Actinomycetes bacterium]